MEYLFERLGPDKFQEFVQALLARSYPATQAFPIGQADGGRDATRRVLKSGRRATVIYQVKYRRNPMAEDSPHRWLRGVIEGEMHHIKRFASAGAAEYILVTNVPGTGRAESGSIDTAQALLDALPIPAQVWWRQDLNARVDGAPDLRWTFQELLTGVDALQLALETFGNPDRERRERVIRAYLADQFSRDEEVRFKQVELQNSLLDLFVDVPAAIVPARLTKARQEHSAAMFRSVVRDLADVTAGEESGPELWDQYGPRGTVAIGAATLMLDRRFQQIFPKVVLEGAPGQGKSTLAQYVCQVHRMRLLQRDTERLLPRALTAPLKFPIRIDLRDYATWLGRLNPYSPGDPVPQEWRRSLESFLAFHVSHYSGGLSYDAGDLIATFATMPTLIVLDGLDEVADLSRRAEVVSEIQSGVRRLDVAGTPIQVIVTSRPAAFAASPQFVGEFAYFSLRDLERSLIDDYADRWMSARALDEREKREFRALISERLDLPHLRDLARNPMQLAILLGLIRTRGTSLPDKRTALYDSYMDLFFSREAEKSEVVRQHRDLLIDLHRYTGWLLHSRAEASAEAGRMRVDDLKGELAEYLLTRGHGTDLVNELFHGMVERVVALVSRIQGTVEFEVQPLREYFAACHLYETAPHSPPGREQAGTLIHRFAAVAPNPFWLNVARFYAGCYSIGEQPSLAAQLIQLLDDTRKRRDGHAAALTSMLLGDWVFSQVPLTVEALLDRILRYPALRYLTSGGAGEPGQYVVWSPQNGQAKLIDRCFELLGDHALPSEQIAEVAATARKNGSKTALKSRWLTEALNARGGDRTRWMQAGDSLGAIQQLTAQELDKLLADGTDGPRRTRLIAAAGHLEYVLRDESRLNDAISDELDQPSRLPLLGGFGPIERLAMAVHSGIYATFVHSVRLNPSASLKRTFESNWVYARKKSKEKSNPDLGGGDLLAFLEGWETAAEQPVEEWTRSLDPWAAVVDLGVRTWGLRPAWISLAVLAGIVKPRREPESAPRILDPERSLVERLRNARRRSGDSHWWSDQLSAATSELETELVLTAAIAYGTERMLSENARILETALASSPVDSFERIAKAVRIVSRTRHVRRIAGTNLLQGSTSPRWAVLLAERGTQSLRASIYSTGATRGAQENAALDFEASHAVGLLLGHRPRQWRSHLERLSQAYVAGADVPHYVRSPEEGTAMPIAMAELVVDDPGRYPSTILGLALQRWSKELRHRPTSEIAAAERWQGIVHPPNPA